MFVVQVHVDGENELRVGKVLIPAKWRKWVLYPEGGIALILLAGYCRIAVTALAWVWDVRCLQR